MTLFLLSIPVAFALSFALVCVGLKVLGGFVNTRRAQSAEIDLRELFSPEEVFEIETRLRLVAIDEWMRAAAVLQHTAARLSITRVPVGAVDAADVESVRIVFSDGTTIIAERPDPFAVALICRAIQAGRVMLRDVDADHDMVRVDFDVDDGAVRLIAARVLVR